MRIVPALIVAFACCLPAVSQEEFSQPQGTAVNPALESSAPAKPNPQAQSVKILYTGRLMGYFREPNWQSPDERDCPLPVHNANGPSENAARSLSAEDFDQLLKTAPPASVLVGTGDNFAPELAAREFCIPPMSARDPAQLGKDLYFWDGNTKMWVLGNDSGSPLAYVPKDNVANFLTRRGYSAVVPGRHDFYFGPERLRQLARLLAGNKIPRTEEMPNRYMPRHPESVQMLGANIVIETSWTKDHAPLTDTERPPTFVPRFMRASDLTILKDLDIQLSGLKDGDTVYPWFVGVKVTFSRKTPKLVLDALGASNPLRALQQLQKSAAPDPKAPTYEQARVLIKILDQSKPRLCLVPRPVGRFDFDNPRNKDEDPNYFKPDASNCRRLTWLPSSKDEDLSLNLDFPWLDEVRRDATLLAGERYRLCFSGPRKPVNDADDPALSDPQSTNDVTFCIRFSTYLPLFQSSFAQQDHGTEQDCKEGNKNCTRRNPMAMCLASCPENQHDPMPFALIEAPEHTPRADDVVIFGVVDPRLGGTIGLLNLAWDNVDPDFKTQVAFKDPGEAIVQLSGYFQRKYKEEHGGSEFKGIRVLLAQMGPQQAQALANGSPDFNIVVSAANQEAANLASSTTTWTPPKPASPDVSVSHPRYMAVPYPHYVRYKGVPEPQWITDIGLLEISLPQGPDQPWMSRSDHLRLASNIGVLPLQEDHWFTQVLFPSMEHLCLSSDLPALPGPANFDERQLQRLNYLQIMTLCAMQRETEADVSLLQKRDIFADLPNYVDQLAPAHRSSQEILDRIIWKGDFLQLIYVPGSALKKALDQSKAFDEEDKSPLSLADETNRGLITLGITFNADRKEYLINGLALDPNKLYSVATSEFIGMGDTGYPDLSSSQAKPPLVPLDAGQDGKFRTISSVVCRHLIPPQDCLPEIEGAAYFDESSALPDDPRIGKTSSRQLELWSVFHRSGKVPGSPALPTANLQAGADKAVSNRALWDFTLTKWSLGLTRLAHTGSNFDVKSLFGGLTSSEPSTVSSTTWTSDLAAQWSRSWHKHQISLSPGYTYNVQHKGQPDDLDQVTQNANRGSLEMGYAGSSSLREPEHYDFLLTARFETPLVTAFNSITLNTTHLGEDGKPIKDQLRIHLDRSFTLLMRPGFRWKRRVSSVEFGPEWAHEWKALTAINFITGAKTVPCSASSSSSLAACASNALKADPNAILGTSIVTTGRNNQDHTGVYWKINMTVPFHRRVSYVLTDAGDFFPVRYGTENSTTTLLRDYSQHQLKIDIFPSLSVGPEFDALLYRNKAVPGLNGHFLFQDQVLMKAQWNFDLFNWRDKRKQLVYAPPSTK